MTQPKSCCACCQTQCCCDPEPRRWLSRVKIKATSDTASIVVPPSCGASAHVAENTMYIRRRGECEFSLAYPAFDKDGAGAVRFILDSKFAVLPAGRYEAQLRQNKAAGNQCDAVVCGSFEIVKPDFCDLKPISPQAVDSAVTVIHSGPIDGVTDVFDEISQFTAPTCKVMETGDDTLKLSDADKVRLCAITLCRPVQLVIFDGVKSETVEFAGCVGGEPVVTRAASSGSAQRFPVGSTVTFMWTTANVAAACEGCTP